jgi:hypothetical protein
MTEARELNLEKVHQWRDAANEAGVCSYGGERVYEQDAGFAEKPGHIYSEAGRKEYKISGCCEFHFDKLFAEEDDPDDTIDELEIDSYDVNDDGPPYKHLAECCADCGEEGELTGHMGCQYPRNHD